MAWSIVAARSPANCAWPAPTRCVSNWANSSRLACGSAATMGCSIPRASPPWPTTPANLAATRSRLIPAVNHEHPDRCRRSDRLVAAAAGWHWLATLAELRCNGSRRHATAAGRRNAEADPETGGTGLDSALELVCRPGWKPVPGGLQPALLQPAAGAACQLVHGLAAQAKMSAAWKKFSSGRQTQQAVGTQQWGEAFGITVSWVGLSK